MLVRAQVLVLVGYAANAASVVHWLGALVGLNRPDPVPAPRARKGTAGPAFAGTFVDREDVDKLVRIPIDACNRLYAPPAELELRRSE